MEESYTNFTQLDGLGFKAGMTIKGPWRDPVQMYGFIRENLIPADMPLIAPDQVHGVDIVEITSKMDNFTFEADGGFTNRQDICLSVTTADCLPVILADPVKGYFGAVHVGWRGFQAGIVENIFKLINKFNLNSGEIHFIIGPGIGQCCFKVGPEVAVLFDESFTRNDSGEFHVDMRGAVKERLERQGAIGSNIHVIPECTRCRSDLYYSYRRDKTNPLQMVTYVHRTTL